MSKKNKKTVQTKQNKNLLIIALVIALVSIITFTNFYKQSNNEILKNPNSFTLGKVDAKVQLVEFFDPACGACGQAHFYVKELMDAYPDKIHVTVRYSPLFPDSRRVVTILEATKKQDMFKESLEAAFNNQKKWVGKPKHKIDELYKILSNLGLDMEKLKQDIKSADVINVVEEDIKAKNTLGIKRTPTFYINGKILEKYSLTNLRDGIQVEMNR